MAEIVAGRWERTGLGPGLSLACGVTGMFLFGKVRKLGPSRWYAITSLLGKDRGVGIHPTPVAAMTAVEAALRAAGVRMPDLEGCEVAGELTEDEMEGIMGGLGDG